MNYNDYFSIESQIGKTISEEEFQCLMAERRIFTTKAKFSSHWEAHSVIGGDIESYHEWSHNVHCGQIVTNSPNDFEEALQIAEERGWNEEVEGVLYGVIPFDAEVINHFDTSNSMN